MGGRLSKKEAEKRQSAIGAVMKQLEAGLLPQNPTMVAAKERSDLNLERPSRSQLLYVVRWMAFHAWRVQRPPDARSKPALTLAEQVLREVFALLVRANDDFPVAKVGRHTLRQIDLRYLVVVDRLTRVFEKERGLPEGQRTKMRLAAFSGLVSISEGQKTGTVPLFEPSAYAKAP